MRAFIAFLKKELLCNIRSGRLILLLILFTCFGIMNPAIAKMTPWLLEIMSEELAESGMTVVDVEVNALTSWTQFFKNVPMALIAFAIMYSTVFTKEYGSGTLILLLTKGLSRYKAAIAKALTVLVIWTAGYYLCFGITYAYNAYFWDNSIALRLGTAVCYWWLYGIFILCGLICLSAACSSSSAVLIGTGGIAILAYVVSFIPEIGEYSPAALMNASSLVFGAEQMSAFTGSVVVTAVISAFLLVVSIPLINRKQL